MGKDFRDVSRSAWSTPSEHVTIEDINCGSLQRIADAVERLGTTWEAMRSAQRQVENLNKANARLWRSINTYRGLLTRLRKGSAK